MNAEVIGIVIFTCQCQRKHVCNTESVRGGVQVKCACGRQKRFEPGSKVNVSITEARPQWRPTAPEKPSPDLHPTYDTYWYQRQEQTQRQYKQDLKEHNQYIRDLDRNQRQNDQVNHTMPLEEYKQMLSDIILKGKQPRIPRKNSKTINFHDYSQQIINIVETLTSMGWNHKDATAQAKIAIENGFVKEAEIVAYIMSL